MSPTVLAELIQAQVTASVRMTIERAAERTAEKLTEELLADPAFRARMRELVTVAFDRALVSMAEPPKP